VFVVGLDNMYFATRYVFWLLFVIIIPSGVMLSVILAIAYYRNILFYMLYVIFVLIVLTITARFAGVLGLNNNISPLILIFLVLLPALNSIFDWLSLSLTRVLLRRIDERKSASEAALGAALGLLVGIVLLASLAVICTAGIQGMNRLSQSHNGPLFFDLVGILRMLKLQAMDPSVLWVYFILFSTLLPTAAHMTVASYSFVFWRLPNSWKMVWLSQIDDGLEEDFIALVNLARWLTVLDAIAIALGLSVTVGLVALTIWGLPWLGKSLLLTCIFVAEVLGARV
jgi:hypothetical protein